MYVFHMSVIQAEKEAESWSWKSVKCKFFNFRSSDFNIIEICMLFNQSFIISKRDPFPKKS